MPDFGVCSDDTGRCGLSYQSFGISRLPDQIHVIQERRLRGGNADELVPHLKRFVRFFQEGVVCSECGNGLIKLTRPTAQLPRDSEGYKRIARANEMIEAMHQLQALGILPA
jgi:hypothetical protein